ncbi:class 1a ribonucleoside-diphosphate reductase subunit alpha [Snodgrassella sp. ESL0324]|uniref:class 1a ribonucleoside-diphosphate reductase subunit alpha n=1 Tax=Snodgrassella sp. ESL0324 TaxID=2705033 RepID=UPI001583E6FB|nr:class 1a ribonucleoside-diphosphate reductase subunit alpha [Snodgrassella sp. ESL0324]NUF08964.1 ribonucleoside-diphosphate reductase subunit alpha [Snodgrassella sp. ESL0324]
MSNLKVTKRNGNLEDYNESKIDDVLKWAVISCSEKKDNQNYIQLEVPDIISEIKANAHIQLYNGISTDDIHLLLIKSAADLISEKQPEMQYIAARLVLFRIRKLAFGDFFPPELYTHITNLTELGLYDSQILKDYSREEIDSLDDFLDHDYDMTFAYAGIKQLEGKYLVQNRTTGKIYESPQFLFMLVAMCLFRKESADVRLGYVKFFYQFLAMSFISLPTPIMAGLRTPTRQFASCVLVDCDDSLDSINTTSNTIVKYISQRAGIGINAGRIRALGSAIRGGEAKHTGCIPFYKMFQAAVKSCSQGGVRGGAATVYFPLWHLEVENLLVLKNNRGVEENRVRHLDYGVQINRLLYTRLIENGKITLFSPSDVPGLYEAFFADQSEFERLYTLYEADKSIRKKTVLAKDLFSILMQERASTGRIYIQNVDHCNTHSAFNPEKAPIYQSNLCAEITLPTRPGESLENPEKLGEVALCTLAAINLEKFIKIDFETQDLDDEGIAASFGTVLFLLVRALDNLLDYQDYPTEAAKQATLARRPLGIGVINFATYLAANGLKYGSPEAVRKTHQLFEAIQYMLLTVSIDLARERGKCSSFEDTSYAQGLLPIDTYKTDIDEFCSTPLIQDWEDLRFAIQKYGLRNSTLTALMPSETSSQVSNATNGIEPPRGLVTVKASKDGILKQVVPHINQLARDYTLAWDIESNEGYLKLVGVMQKFVDQSISANTYYDPAKYENAKVPMKVLLRDLLTAYKYGVKTLYYHNTRDGSDDTQDSLADSGCDSGACKI